MEAEETAPAEQLATDIIEHKMEEAPVVEELTDTDIGDISVISAEPVVEESDKTDDKETEKMEKEVAEPALPESVPAEDKKEETPTAEKTPEVITKIEEITDKQSLPDVAEVIDDLEPVVEEPTAVEDIESHGKSEIS